MFGMQIKGELFFILFISVITAAQSQETLADLLGKYNSHSVPYISPEELAQQSKQEALLLLDVRDKIEFEVSHIPKAIHLGSDNFASHHKILSSTKKDAPIVVYCSVGVRSEKMGLRLEKMGFNNVKNLYGGIFEWKNKGYSVVDSAGKDTQNVHVFSKKWKKWLKSGTAVLE